MRRSVIWLPIVALCTAAMAQTTPPTISHDATAPVRAGDVIAITSRGPVGAKATIQFEGQTREWLIPEAQPGLYQGEYTVRRDDDINDKRLYGIFRLTDGTVLRAEAPNAIGKPVPAPAPKPVAASQIEITKVTINGPDWLRAGQSAEIVVEGTTGCLSGFSVPGFDDNYRLYEKTKGVYTGTWVAPAGANGKERPVVAWLVKDKQTDVAVADKKLNFDSAAPVLFTTSPRANDEVPANTTLLRAGYDDLGGSDLDLKASQLMLDGVDVSRYAKAAGSILQVTLPKPLEAGNHTWTLVLTDAVGNQARPASVAFKVLGANTPANPDTKAPDTPGAKTPVLTHNGINSPTPGAELIIRLEAEPGGKATFSIGEAVRDVAMRELRPGFYEGVYTVRRTDQLNGLPVIATYTNAAGVVQQVRAATGIATKPGETPSAPAALVAPTFTSHREGDRVDAKAKLAGRSTPGATVEINVTSVGAALFGLLGSEGTPINATATVNDKGEWTTDTLNFDLPPLANRATYTVTAVTVRGAERSQTTTMKLSR